MLDSSSRPYVSLWIGVILTGLGLASALTGQSLLGHGRTANRVDEPKKFWGAVAMDFLGGALGIGYFLYEKYIAN